MFGRVILMIEAEIQRASPGKVVASLALSDFGRFHFGYFLREPRAEVRGGVLEASLSLLPIARKAIFTLCLSSIAIRVGRSLFKS